MALNLLRTRGASVVASRPTFLVAQRAAFATGIRMYATDSKDGKLVEPKQKAQSVIDSLPGNNIITKTGYITVGTGLATYAISKELYVFNEETLILVSFAGLFYVLYRGLRQPANEYFEEKATRINNALREAREDHKSAVEGRIGTVSLLGDIVNITKGLFTLSKETARLEAEAFELKQKAAVTAEIKSVLDSWVRYETSVREREQRALSEHVIAKVKESLQDPRMQQQLLDQSVSEVESLVKLAPKA